MASATESADPAGAMTDSGDAAPAEVYSAMVSRPSAASDSVRNCSVVDRPMFAPNRPVPSSASSTTMPARILPGRSDTKSATRYQPDFFAFGSSSSTFGIFGQNSLRPNRDRAAGSTNRANARATSRPIDSEMPR